MTQASVTEILLVEDNPADRDLTSDVLGRNPCAPLIHHAADGVAALMYLRTKSSSAAMRLPNLVLLDLNLPLKNGREVLAEIKADPALRSIPVVIFSTSQVPTDIRSSYELGANSYVCKPCNLTDFVTAVTSIGEFWSRNAQPAN